MKVYAAMHSTPDYSGSSASLVSIHETFNGAFKALYPKPEQERYKQYFLNQPWSDGKHWNGPDGFGLIQLMEVEP